MLEENVSLTCPYCGETLDINVDCSAGSQSYIEDCQVCCRPIELQMECDPAGKLSELIARRDDE